MKALNTFIIESINSRKCEAYTSLVGVKDSEGMPVEITICFNKKDLKAIEEWAEKEQDNIFIHWDSENVEY